MMRLVMFANAVAVMMRLVMSGKAAGRMTHRATSVEDVVLMMQLPISVVDAGRMTHLVIPVAVAAPTIRRLPPARMIMGAAAGAVVGAVVTTPQPDQVRSK